MSSTVSSTIYHKRMELNNGMDIDSDPPNRNSRFILQERKRQGNSSQEGGWDHQQYEASTTLTNHGNHASVDNIQAQPPRVDDDNDINIQLPYDPNCCRLKTLELVMRINLVPGWHKRTR